MIQTVPARTSSNLLVGSWNLRALAGLTDSWNAPESASPEPDLRAAALIAAMISAFDIVAVQEVRRETTALRAVLAELDPDWQFVCSDVTAGLQLGDLSDPCPTVAKYRVRKALDSLFLPGMVPSPRSRDTVTRG